MLGASSSLVDFLHQEVLPRLSVEDVYREVAFVSRRGRFWRAGCPLHGGRDPNFTVDTETLFYNCFSQCGSGSVVAFLNRGEPARGQRFVELLRELSDLAGVPFPQRTLSPEELRRVERARRRTELLEAFATAAGQQLLDSPSALAYLAGRGFSSPPEDLARAGLGITPGLPALQGRTTASADELRECGFGMRGWEGRLTLTWRDQWRRISTFAARELPGAQGGPKYLYLKDAPRPPFFGLDRFARGRTPTRVVIVEGMLDVVQLGLVGIDGVLAIGSALISDRHIATLADLGVENVVLALDGDDAGRRGTDQFIELARKHLPDLRVSVVPVGAMRGHKDPGELAAAMGAPEVHDAIAARRPAAIDQAERAVLTVGPGSPVIDRREGLAQLADLADRLVGRDRDADLHDLVDLGIARTGYDEDIVRSHLGAPNRPHVAHALVADIHAAYGSPVSVYTRREGQPMYQAEISRRNPTAFVFLLDQSFSMSDAFGDETKAAFLATVVNRQIAEMVLRCTKEEGVRDYFELAVIGYGTEVDPALATGGAAPVPISQVAGSPLRVEDRSRAVPDGAGGLVDLSVKFPVWVDPVAGGATRMCEALRTTQDMLADWIDAHPDAFPPTVINVTDGASTDGDPTEPAADLASLATRDGSVLLFNVHVTSAAAGQVEFPTTDESLIDPFAKQLFAMSSELPAHLVEAVSTSSTPVPLGARGFTFNANPISLTRFLTVGTTFNSYQLR